MKQGIPTPERFIARLLIRRWCRSNPPESTIALVRVQQQDLIDLIRRAGSKATSRVQIARLRGLEQSSTNYSLAMVAQHLAMTNTDMAATISALTANRPPDIEVVIARYKPSPDITTSEALDNLEHSIAALESALADPAAIRRARRTHPHPWFGPLTAATWACFPTFHQALHLKQAHQIFQGLGS